MKEQKKIIPFLIFLCLGFLLPGQAVKETVCKEITLEYDASHLVDSEKDVLATLLEIPNLVEIVNAGQDPQRRVRVFKRRISRLLKKAAGLTRTPGQKEYFETLAESVLTGNFSAIPAVWLARENPAVDILLAPKNGAPGPGLAVTILVYRPTLREKTAKYIAVLDKMLDNLPKTVQAPPLDPGRVAPVLVADLVYSSTPPARVLMPPARDKNVKTGRFKMILLHNLLEADFTHLVKPLAEGILGKGNAGFVVFDAYFTNQLLHRLSHYLGPVFVDKKQETPTLVRVELKEHYAPIEELRADTAALYNIPLLVTEKILDEEGAKQIYHTFLAVLVAKLRAKTHNEINRHRLVLMEDLLKQGALVFNLTGKILRIERKKLEEASRKLLNRSTLIESQGDRTGAAGLTGPNAASVPEPLKLLKKKLANYPYTLKVTGYTPRIASEPPQAPAPVKDK